MRRNYRSFSIYKYIGRSGRDPRFQPRDPGDIGTGKKLPTIEPKEISTKTPIVVYAVLGFGILLILKVLFGR